MRLTRVCSAPIAYVFPTAQTASLTPSNSSCESAAYHQSRLPPSDRLNGLSQVRTDQQCETLGSQCPTRPEDPVRRALMTPDDFVTSRLQFAAPQTPHTVLPCPDLHNGSDSRALVIPDESPASRMQTTALTTPHTALPCQDDCDHGALMIRNDPLASQLPAAAPRRPTRRSHVWTFLMVQTSALSWSLTTVPCPDCRSPPSQRPKRLSPAGGPRRLCNVSAADRHPHSVPHGFPVPGRSRPPCSDDPGRLSRVSTADRRAQTPHMALPRPKHPNGPHCCAPAVPDDSPTPRLQITAL